MSNISLLGPLKTCKVNTDWSPRIQSDRFENTNSLLCPTWTRKDLVGRNVHTDTFRTEIEGCNIPTDRIDVENDLRPKYAETSTLDTLGFTDEFQYTNGGVNIPADGYCSAYPYEYLMAYRAQQRRFLQSVHLGSLAQRQRVDSGEIIDI